MSGRDGIVLVDKPRGWRSRQVVDAVGKAFRIRKIGHAGTLDPGATGLIVVLLGEGTKLSRFLMEGRKVYRAVIRLGIATDTYDADGKVTATHSLEGLTSTHVREALSEFRGTIMQRPPDYAAVKVRGQPLYKYTRRGEVVDVEAREVTIHSLTVNRIELPDVEIEMACSKGTYVRSVAHDLGQKLGVGGHLIDIRRIESAPFHVNQATPADELVDLSPEDCAKRVIPLDQALAHVPLIQATPQLAGRVANGQSIEGELLYGHMPEDLSAGDLVQIRTPERLAVLRLIQAPADLGPPPWRGTQPLRYERILHI